MQFGVREVTAAQVARVLGMMARTHSGLTDGIPLQVNIEISCSIVWINILSSLLSLLNYSMIDLPTRAEHIK